MSKENDKDQMRDMIWSILPKDGDDRPKAVKKLRKQVLLALQLDEDDRASKKLFKKTIQELEASKQIKIDVGGSIEVLSRKRSGDDEGEKKSKKKRKKDIKVTDNVGDSNEAEVPEEKTNRSKPCKGNPQGVTRLFLGNLPFAVDEASLQDFIPGTVTHIKWITDKDTGKFYGSAFIEVQDSSVSAKAVAKAGQQLMGRPIKINFAPARPGDVWPPQKTIITGGGATGGQAGGSGIKAMSEKPELCTKLFMGNCSFEIDDDTIIKFFGAIDVEVRAIRWLHHKDSGDFKGCGFCEFWTPEACEKAATLNGKTVMGRPIRLDWTE